jgi:hypothetical protein
MFLKAIGLVILILGFILTIYTGFDFSSKEKVVDMGSFQITHDKEHTTNWSPLIGIGTMVIGGVVFFSGSKKPFRIGPNRID